MVDSVVVVVADDATVLVKVGVLCRDQRGVLFCPATCGSACPPRPILASAQAGRRRRQPTSCFPKTSLFRLVLSQYGSRLLLSKSQGILSHAGACGCVCQGGQTASPGYYPMSPIKAITNRGIVHANLSKLKHWDFYI